MDKWGLEGVLLHLQTPVKKTHSLLIFHLFNRSCLGHGHGVRPTGVLHPSWASCGIGFVPIADQTDLV